VRIGTDSPPRFAQNPPRTPRGGREARVRGHGRLPTRSAGARVLFNSFEFLVFLPIVLIGYYLLPHRLQNAFLVLASCWFYASWDWRFLIPLLVSTTIDYVIARRLEDALARGAPVAERRRYLLFSLVTNLGLLGFFKYCNFFIDSAHALLSALGIDVPVRVLDVILPVGISFYTFQALSYTIDVYRGQIHATRSFWDFFLAVLFFPHLVAGPIQRASNLLAQVTQPRRPNIDQWIDGLHLIVWGFFKKVFIADRIAPIVNAVFNAPAASGGETLVAVLGFAIQIYCDFSGYTDIARGVAKLMGFEFMLNFNLPYFATNPSDFWKRWHISLSSWLRDYLYIPLGGNQATTARTYRNLMLTMVLGGLWHGAAWNFVLWGAYHGTLLIGHRLASPLLARTGQAAAGLCGHARWASRAGVALRIGAMFVLTCYGWLLFRAGSFAQIASMTASLASPLQDLPTQALAQVLWLTLPLACVQGVQFASGRLEFHRLPAIPRPLMAVAYGAMLYAIVFLGGEPQAFVYFQF
jgi:D-alanyl-lipoteichoic acid acyltransferase DltB (MBOAT superfamily)